MQMQFVTHDSKEPDIQTRINTITVPEDLLQILVVNDEIRVMARDTEDLEELAHTLYQDQDWAIIHLEDYSDDRR